MNSYKTPKDKLICVLNCCKLIYSMNLLESTHNDKRLCSFRRLPPNFQLESLNRNKDQPAGADEFLPLLIYVVIRASPGSLHTTVEYVLSIPCLFFVNEAIRKCCGTYSVSMCLVHLIAPH